MKTSLIFLALAATLSGLISVTPAAQSAEIVTISTGRGATAAGPSLLPSFSGDGRYLLFLSQANNLVTNDDRAPHLDLFRWDLTSGAATLVSVNQTGQGGGDADANFGQISSNGQWIVFASAAGNLVAGDNNRASDVFVRDLIADTTRLVSQTPGGLSGNAASTAPVMSTDGRWVAFESSASDLAQLPDTNGVSDIYVRDLGSNVTALVSVGSDGASSGSGASDSPAISADGRFVVFVSTASNLVTTPPESLRAVYVRDLKQSQTVCASAGLSPFFAGTYQVPPQQPVVSSDGRFIVFTVENRLFRFDRLLNSTVGVGVGPQFPSDFRATLSADGRFIAYQDGTNVWRWDGVLQTNVLINLTSDGAAPTNGYSFSPVLSADSRQVLFYSSASGLVTNEGNPFSQLYLRDLTSGLTRLLSLNQSGNAGDHNSYPGTAVFSPDGTSVAFDSPAGDVVADDANQASDVFLCQLGSSTVELVSRRLPNLPAATSVADCLVSPTGVSTNGQVVVIESADNQFTPNDINGRRDWFVIDSAIGTQTPLTPGLPESPRRYPSLSADGRFVAFATTSSTGSSGVKAQIHRLDILTGTHDVITRVTNYISGYPYPLDIEVATAVMGYTNTNLVVISPDGTKVAFGLLTPMSAIRIHDFSLNTEWVVSNSFDSVWIPLAFSPNGEWLTFAHVSSSWLSYRIYQHNLAIQQTSALVTNVNTALPLALAFSADSRFVAYPVPVGDSVANSDRRIYRRTLDLTGPDLLVCTNCSEPSISSGGRFVAYVRRSDQGTRRDAVLVKDLQTGVEQLITTSRFGMNAANGMSYQPRITPDGRYVVFASAASDLVANDTNKMFDIFLRDRLLGPTTCLSVNQQGVPAGGSSGNPILSGDGRTVVFQSTASDLVFADYNDKRDVFAVRIGHDDTDGDGLDDDWEMAFFENLAHDGTVDSDSDGLSDHVEFLAGTDPTNQGSVLCATTLVPQGGGNPAILWQAVPGRTYQVQFKNSLSDVNWSVLPGTFTATTTAGVMTDATASGQPQRFFRVVLAP